MFSKLRLENIHKRTLTFNNQRSLPIETSQLICRANQLTGFYMMETLAVKGLRVVYSESEKN